MKTQQCDGVAFIQSLQDRQLIFQKTADEALATHLDQPRVIYCGFDPTGDSLHVGSLLQLVNLKRWQDAGHTPILLIGGATGMIGDPSFKSNERNLLDDERVQHNVACLLKQVKAYVKLDGIENAARVVNNLDWISKIGTLDFLRDVGKHFTINTMVARDSVKQRLERDGAGLSFTEFSYSILQALDFEHLYKQHECTVQLGGSDQWGNIVSGVDFVRRKTSFQVFGMTLPLIVKSDGTKFGKTESGAVWLDSVKTSPYAFYQFWINVSDDDVYRFLAQFTFLELEVINQIEAQDKASGRKPEAQQRLAQEVTRVVHGQEGVDAAERIAAALFGGDVKTLAADELQQLSLDGLPCFTLPKEISLVDALIETGMASSKRAAREFINNKAVRINSEIFDGADDAQFLTSQFLHQQYLVLQRGRKNHVLILAKR